MSAELEPIPVDDLAPPLEDSTRKHSGEGAQEEEENDEAQHPAPPPPPSASLAPAPLPPSPARSASISPSQLTWPSNHPGLVCFFDPTSSQARDTCQLLQEYTNNTLSITPWLIEATHVLLDDSKPVWPESWEGEGREIVNLAWARESFFAGESMDPGDERYRIVKKEEIKPVVRRERQMKRLKGGREHPVRMGKVERKRGREEEEERSTKKKPSWSYEIVLPSEEDGLSRPAVQRPPPRPWTEDEEMNLARVIISKGHLDAAAWSEYQASHPSRTIRAYDSHYHDKKAHIDRLIQRIKRRAKKQAEHDQPASLSPSRTPSSSRRTLTPPPTTNHDSSDQDDGDDDDETFGASNPRVARKSGGLNALELRRSATGEPCTNCHLVEDERWYRLLDVDDGAGQYCEGCRTAFRSGAKTSIAEGKAYLAKRRRRLVVPSRRGTDHSRNENVVAPFPPPPPPPPRRFQRQRSLSPPPVFAAPAPAPPPGREASFFPSHQPHAGPSSFAASFMDHRPWAPAPPSPPPSSSTSTRAHPMPTLDEFRATMMGPAVDWNDASRRPPSPSFFADQPMGSSRFGNQFGMDSPLHSQQQNRRSLSPPHASSFPSMGMGMGPSSFASTSTSAAAGSSFFASASASHAMRMSGESRDDVMGGDRGDDVVGEAGSKKKEGGGG